MNHQFKPCLTKPVLRLGQISYMNVAPIYYGFNNGHKPGWINMICAPPSVLNKMLANGELDVSPVSSAAYARNHDKWLLLPDISISCSGPVMSVILVSRYPFEELSGKTVILTRESATAAALSRFLFASQNIKPYIKTGKVRCADDLDKDADAALVIGDAALKEEWTSKFNHVWDLGEMWKNHTGLPFVFALWAVRRDFANKYPELVLSIEDQFQKSRLLGKKNMSRILSQASEKLGISVDKCRQYYNQLLYDLSPEKIKGVESYFRGLYQENIISRPVKLSFVNPDPHAFIREHAA
ncbi:Menaquinone biosynthesis protein [Desulfonema limicola]|uniref:Chorismate dehydratase n=1 Tax=Desulfonema limicola TaxID=45656 RepID=A0A975B4E1_9BACT|nr:menaquinone biosynthesis protein [Desulfonema limicola]QTA78602.1 Menaquinone biosynthesis protein [Desulfonema limicola]